MAEDALTNDDFVAWPFPILEPESSWSEFDRDLIDYVQSAYAEGFGREGSVECL